MTIITIEITSIIQKIVRVTDKLDKNIKVGMKIIVKM